MLLRQRSPALLRERDKDGDRERAKSMETLVIPVCRRAEARASRDPFLLDTLFGALFRRSHVAAAEEMLDRLDMSVS